MIASIKSRVLRLEQSQQNTNSRCFGLDYFYGLTTIADAVPFVSLSDFYQSFKQDQQHGQ